MTVTKAKAIAFLVTELIFSDKGCLSTVELSALDAIAWIAAPSAPYVVGPPYRVRLGLASIVSRKPCYATNLKSCKERTDDMDDWCQCCSGVHGARLVEDVVGDPNA